MQNGHSTVRRTSRSSANPAAWGSNHQSPAIASGSWRWRSQANRASRPGASGGRTLAFHEAGFDGDDGGTGAVRDLEFAEDRGDVGLHGLVGDEKPLGDLTVRLARGE